MTETAPLDVDADLVVSVDGAEGEIRSTGDVILVEFDSLSDASIAADARPPGVLDRLPAMLYVADLTVEIRVRGRTVVVSGTGASPGVISRRLGVAPNEIRPLGVLSAVAAGVSAPLNRAYEYIDG